MTKYRTDCAKQRNQCEKWKTKPMIWKIAGDFMIFR